MSLLDPDPDLTDPRRARAEVRRTVDRLRSMPIGRLDRPAPGERAPEGPDDGTPARRTRTVAQALADETAQLAGLPCRQLPELPAPSCGDLLAVCAADLLDVLAVAPDPLATARLAQAMIELRKTL